MVIIRRKKSALEFSKAPDGYELQIRLPRSTGWGFFSIVIASLLFISTFLLFDSDSLYSMKEEAQSELGIQWQIGTELVRQLVDSNLATQETLYGSSHLVSLGDCFPPCIINDRELVGHILRSQLDFVNFYDTVIRFTPHRSPIPGKVRITSSFGNRKNPFDFSSKQFHGGVDIRAANGDPVLATAGGLVLQSGYRGGYGKAVRIFHPSGYETMYAHMSSIKVKTGDIIKEGDVLGLAGSTGHATGPHLHYEIVEKGKRIDPLNFLSP